MSQSLQYAELDLKQLYQGDVLVRTDALNDVLKGIYPYVHSEKEKYQYFIILTQSCDLISRNGIPPKADQITIAAVRSIRYFLSVEVAKVQRYPTLKRAGICTKEKKTIIIQMLERLISNDEDPYFYLHPGSETPYNDPMVAYLRITFPLRLTEHYETCRKAKAVQLDPIFQAKLGWLTTLVFGQVGTIDFPPETRHLFATQYLSAYNDVAWIKRGALISGAKKEGKESNLSKISKEDLKTVLELFKKVSYQEIITDRIIQIAERIFELEGGDIRKFRAKLLKDAEIMSAFVE
jgi:hypothetical protein